DAAAAVDHAAGVGLELLAVLERHLGRAAVVVLVGDVVVVEGAVVALDIAPRRRVVLRRRQRQAGAVVEGVDALHQPFAPARLADDHAAVVILDGAGDDLGGRRAA